MRDLSPTGEFSLTVIGPDLIIDTTAEVAQVVEHGTENAGVDSSSLSLGTINDLGLVYRGSSRTSLRATGKYRAEVAQW